MGYVFPRVGHKHSIVGDDDSLVDASGIHYAIKNWIRQSGVGLRQFYFFGRDPTNPTHLLSAEQRLSIGRTDCSARRTDSNVGIGSIVDGN